MSFMDVFEIKGTYYLFVLDYKQYLNIFSLTQEGTINLLDTFDLKSKIKGEYFIDSSTLFI